MLPLSQPVKPPTRLPSLGRFLLYDSGRMAMFVRYKTNLTMRYRHPTLSHHKPSVAVKRIVPKPNGVEISAAL
jgi:hypothetical protein